MNGNELKQQGKGTLPVILFVIYKGVQHVFNLIFYEDKTLYPYPPDISHSPFLLLLRKSIDKRIEN